MSGADNFATFMYRLSINSENLNLLEALVPVQFCTKFVFTVNTKTNMLNFYILLTVHLDVILVNGQFDALFLQCIYFNASTCFEQQVLIIRRTNLY